MANIFTIILVIATLITGIIWCINRFKLARKHCTKQISTDIDKVLNDKTLGKNLVKPTWIETVASLFPALAVVLIIRSFIFEPFQIPSGSMMPTLLIGDFIIVNKFAYGIKEPVTQTKLIPIGSPHRGDIAVFRYPKDPSINYIKRVIGIPGDKVVLDPYSNTITINPGCSLDKCGVLLPITYSNIELSDFILVLKSFYSNELINTHTQLYSDKNKSILNNIRLSIRKENIGNVTHNILLMNDTPMQESMYYHQPDQPPFTWIVPKGQYFMMGDNRDNSFDSRYWGFVPENNLVGKVIGIWMSFEKQEKQWPTGVRLSRIGRVY